MRNEVGFYKFDYIGKFSFITINGHLGRSGLLNRLKIATSLVAFAVDRVVSKSHQLLYYYNKNKKWTEATGQAIGWLIKDDKDILQEFNAEKNTITKCLKSI